MSDFVSFVRSLLVKEAHTFHFFQREYSFAVYGSQATALAKEYYGTRSVLKHDIDLEFITLSKSLFSKLACRLINSNFEVKVWTKVGNIWQVLCQGSPGDVSALSAVVIREEMDLLKNNAVVSSIFYRENGNVLIVGLAVYSELLGRVTVVEFQDCKDFINLRTNFTQHAVRECHMPHDDASERSLKKPRHAQCEIFRTAEELMTEMKISVKRSPMSLFSSKGGLRGYSSIQQALLAVVVSEEVGTKPTSVVTAISEMSCGLPALVGLLASVSSIDKFILTVGGAEHLLNYDASVGRALQLFPEPNSSRAEAVSSEASFNAVKLVENEDEIDSDEIEVGHGMKSESCEVGDTPASTSSGRQRAASTTLFGLLNTCKTKMGSRLLRRWLQQPLCDKLAICQRQEAVAFLVSKPIVRNNLRDCSECLKGFPDIDNIVLRLKKQLQHVTLWDLLVLYRCAAKLDCISTLLTGEASTDLTPSRLPTLLIELRERKQHLEKFMQLIETVIDIDQLSTSTRSALPWERFGSHSRKVQVRPSFTPELQATHVHLSKSSGAVRAQYESICSAAGVDEKLLHFEYSSTHGFHLRATKKEYAAIAKKLTSKGAQSSPIIISQQKAGVLFVTSMLKKLLAEHTRLTEQFEMQQREIVFQAVEVSQSYIRVFEKVGCLLAELDCFAALAHVAALRDWTMPTLEPLGSKNLVLSGLRHPCVEANLARSSCGVYVPSDLTLGPTSYAAVITGPNMGGKSTFIRAVGLTIVLAHIGSFVPATAATIPLVDRIMTRVGSADSLERGVSTFMSEMQDIGGIIRHATRNSLVIIDELGRGTSTHEGFGLAWSVLRRLAAETRCMTLFATHFRELTTMDSEVSEVFNLHVSAVVTEETQKGGSITMLYEVTPGVCSRSFGIEVAKLANFPENIISDAKLFVTEMSRDK